METECDLWPGRINADGYGTWGSKLVHRIAWEEEHGPIPPDMTLDHKCHDPHVCRLGKSCPHRRCRRLDHLRLLTPEQNKALGSQGWYNREKSHCPEDHEYTPENTLISGGKRYCRTCRRLAEKERRAAAKVEACRNWGHERQEAVGSDGRRYCVVCMLRVSRQGSAAQWGTKAARSIA